VLLTTLAYFSGVGLVLPLDWSRYYVPTALLGTLLSGIGLAALVGRLAALRAGLPDRRALRTAWVEPDAATLARTES
jgi:hypothetical protein